MERPLKIVATVPDEEQKICARVRQARVLRRWKQSDFARDLGITRERLASYEYARAPIRFGVAQGVCRFARVTLWWLAEGSEPREWPAFIPAGLREQIPARMLLSEAYERFLKPHLEGQRLEASSMASGLTDREQDEIRDVFPISVPYPDEEMFFQSIMGLMRGWIKDLPPQFCAEYARALGAVSREFVARKKKLLTVPSLKGEMSDMQSDLQKLLARIKQLTQERGAKARLSELLGVHQSKVSEWLSGKKEPGGKITLRLLKWVDQQKR